MRVVEDLLMDVPRQSREIDVFEFHPCVIFFVALHGGHDFFLWSATHEPGKYYRCGEESAHL